MSTISIDEDSTNVSREESEDSLYTVDHVEKTSIFAKFDTFFTEKRRKLFKIGHLGISFCFLFSSYTTTQSLVTKVFPDIGRSGLSILYLMFALSCFFAPVTVHKLGLRPGLTLASILYSNFVFSCVVGNPIYFIISCIANGCAASVLWVSQGVFLSRTADKDWMGQATGLFYSILSFSGIIGNLIIGPLVLKSSQLTLSLWVLFGLGCLAVILLFFIRSPHPNDTENVMTVKERLISTIKTAIDRKMITLLPYIFYQGASGSFSFGVLSPLLDVTIIPFVFVTYSLTVIASSSLYGKAFDKFSWKFLVSCNVIAVILTYSSVLVAIKWKMTWVFFLSAILLGTLDSLVNTLVNSTIGKNFSKDPAGAFSVYRVGKSLGTSAALFIEGYITYEITSLLLFIMCLVAVVSFRYFHQMAREGVFDYEMVPPTVVIKQENSNDQNK